MAYRVDVDSTSKWKFDRRRRNVVDFGQRRLFSLQSREVSYQLLLGALEVSDRLGDDVHLVGVAVQVEALAEEAVQHTAHEGALHAHRYGRVWVDEGKDKYHLRHSTII